MGNWYQPINKKLNIILILSTVFNFSYSYAQNNKTINYNGYKFSFPTNIKKIKKQFEFKFENGYYYKGVLDENSIIAYVDNIAIGLAFAENPVSEIEFINSNVYSVSFENIDSVSIDSLCLKLSKQFKVIFEKKTSKNEIGKMSENYIFNDYFFIAKIKEDTIILVYHIFNKKINKNISSVNFCYKLKDNEIFDYLKYRGILVDRSIPNK